jgi:hypothetical protein
MSHAPILNDNVIHAGKTSSFAVFAIEAAHKAAKKDRMMTPLCSQ